MEQYEMGFKAFVSEEEPEEERKTPTYINKVEPYLNDIAKLIESGKTEEEIANWLGISKRTFQRYKGKYSELKHVVEYANERTIQRVERTLLDTALGYQYIDYEIIDGSVVPIPRIAKPDFRAIKLYLNNKGRGRWYDGDKLKQRKIEKEIEKLDTVIEMLKKGQEMDEEEKSVVYGNLIALREGLLGDD